MDIITRIRLMEHEFTSTDINIADCIRGAPSGAMLMTARELAQASGTSSAAVIRFIRKLGFVTMNEMRSELAKASDDASAGESADLIVRQNDTARQIVGKVTGLVGEIAADINRSIHFQALEEAAGRLRRADTIHIYGIGASAIVASDLYQKLLRINRRAVFTTDSHLQVAASVNVSARDAAVAFSFSGETREVVTALTRAHKNGAYCIAVTKSSPSNPLSKTADCVFTLPDIEGELRLGAISSRYGQLIVSDVLFMCIAQDDMEKTREYLVESRNIINTLRK